MPLDSLPENLINAMMEAGAILDTVEDAVPFQTLRFDQNSAAHQVFIQHARQFDNDQNPPDSLLQAMLPADADGVIPTLANQLLILFEANSVIMSYAGLLARTFAVAGPGPILFPALMVPPGPLVPAIGVMHHHCSIAAHAVLHRISSGVGLPTIAAQPSGTVLCYVNYIYANVAFSIKCVRA